jgi:putative membrane protein
MRDGTMSELNDPRVLFAAERTLLAWNRTSISLMAFGFLIERFGLFLEIVGRKEIKVFQRNISFIVGLAFILLASYIAFSSIHQHRRVLRTLKPSEIPADYNVRIGIFTNAIVGVLGILLIIYLSRQFL